MISLPHLAITAALQKGNDNPMDEDTVLRVTLPIKIAIDSVKKAEATVQQAFDAYEFFKLAENAALSAMKHTNPDAIELLEQRANRANKAARIAKTTHRRLEAKEPQTCTGEEIKALDDGFTAAVELHEALPEWAFMQGGYKIIKDRTVTNSNPRKKRRNR